MSFLKVAKTVQNAAAVAQRDGIGSLFKRLHLFNTLRPNARLAGQDQFGNKYYEDVTGELQCTFCSRRAVEASLRVQP